ncbi:MULTISPECIES: SPOR domain-containing protein [Alphaproteobacteria]|uniref:Sporulation protein n=2 Tax=Alphaproteobacteria TaxID=28211 RepID=A0A512HHF2_9HYPH|nr:MULTISPECIES: SPOR domain-containing protein [Alphaproteobacteria]GEO84877.1 sporulation protein [Ciceribacter naphthalenivorans]GLR22811.1 sporulation protein [Ciceribacter naphthalenivorans]GLT05667.1 sporulation protein [Sphingomonas psychrolutea]
MVQKQAAFSSRLGSDSFADDDPLAELARIVGFESPVERDAAPTRPAEPEAEIFNLEDELLREFEVYDAPVRGDERSFAAESAATLSPAPLDDIEDLEDVFYPEQVVEPVAQVQAMPAEPQSQPERPTEPTFEAPAESFLSTDLADELELAVSEPQESQRWPVAEPVSEPRLRLPLANFSAQPAVRSEPQFVAPEPQPEPQVEVAAAAAVGEAASAEDAFFADAGFEWSNNVSGPSSVVPAAPAHRGVDPFGLDDLVANAAERSVELSSAAPESAVRSDPPFNFSFADDLAVSEDEPVSAEPPLAASRLAAVSEPVGRLEPLADVRPPLAEEEFDPFVDGEFDLHLDDLELDLSEIEVDFEEPAAPLTPVVKQPVPSLATPAALAPTPVAVSAPAMPSVAAAPPVARPVAVEAKAPPAAPALPEFDFADEPLAFDPSEISEQEEHVEAIAHMDVPEVPVPESKPAQASYTHDYDLDLDGELANLFEQPPVAPAAVPQKPVATPVAAAQPSPASIAAAPAASQPQAAKSANGGLPPMDDFDAFERALEEDFRHTLDRPSDYPASSTGRIAIPMEPKGLSRLGGRNMLMAGSAAVAVLLGGGALYYWLSGSTGSMMSSGEPPVILADKDPVKMVPENPGGKSVPNQDKAVYDRVAGAPVADPKQESLISASEEPVDVVQKTLIPENLPLEGESDTGAEALGTPVGETEDPRLLPDQGGAEQAPAATDQPATITPRKVRTMIVRPDGTLVAQEAPEAPAPTLNSPAETAPATTTRADKPALAAPSTTGEPASIVAPADAPTGPIPMARPATPASSQAAVQPKPVPAAQVQTAPVQAAPAAAPAASESATTQPAPAAGGYYIQVASLPSQAEAEKSYKNVSAKFASVIGGRAHEIKQADIAGKGTYYRVRISAGTKAEAQALCERYKAAGGSCLVAK